MDQIHNLLYLARHLEVEIYHLSIILLAELVTHSRIRTYFMVSHQNNS